MNEALNQLAMLVAELYSQLCTARQEIARRDQEIAELRGRITEEHQHVEVLDNLLHAVGD